MSTKPDRNQYEWIQKTQTNLPLWVFVGVLLATVLFYLFPLDLRQVYAPDTLPPGTATAPALFVYPVGLAEAGARCPNSCVIQVCTRWVPGPSDQCPNPGPGGGCCLAYRQECDPECEDQDQDQPPTISASQSCSQPGSGNWCIGSLSLDLSASDPQGQTVLISGDVGGIPFACANGATSCSVPLPEGNGTVNYRVTSATGLSDSDSQSYRRDTSLPQITGGISGSNGENGWYISPVTASASANDAISGVASLSYSLNQGTWTSYTSALTLTDGEHTLEFQAVDAAGNQSAVSQTIDIDTMTPILDLSVTGTTGANGWYRSNVQVAASAGDSGSGLEVLEYRLNDGGWTDYSSALTLADGEHSLSIRAVDLAGNETQAEQILRIDSLTPVINISVTGTTGANGWYASGIQVDASSSDLTSGPASLEYSADGVTWVPYTTALTYTDGRHGLKLRATDSAGNSTTTPELSYWVDTTPPVIDLPDAWDLGFTAEYEVLDDESGVASVRIVIEDDAERWPKLTWNDAAQGEIPWDGRFADGNQVPDGEYLATIKAKDQAGNESVKTGIITVENNLLTIFLPPFIPPVNTPTPPPTTVAPSEDGSFGGETNDEGLIPETGTTSIGGLATVAGTGGTASFATETLPAPEELPATGILWGATAMAAAGAFLAEIEKRRQEEREAARRAHEAVVNKKGEKDNPLTYKQIAKAYQAAVDNFKSALKSAQGAGMSAEQAAKLKADVAQSGKIGGALGAAQSHVAQTRAEQQARKDAVAEARVLGKEAMIEAETRAYSAKPQEWAAVLGGSKQDKSKEESKMKVSAMPMPGEDEPSFWERLQDGLTSAGEWFWDGITWMRERIFGTGETSSPVATPTLPPPLVGITPAPTQMPTSIPTATIVPTPVLQTAYISSPNVNFRTDPDTSKGDANIISKLACGTSFRLTGERISADDYIWHKVLVGDQAGWVVENFISEQNKVCPNFAAKYATYPGVRETVHFTSLPFEYVQPSSWWGFGNTTFARDHKYSYYIRTAGLHPGLDWGIPYGTTLIWNGNVSGKVIDGAKYAYLVDEPYIVIEAGGFHHIYAHTSQSLVSTGDIVNPGQVIGQSGQDKYGNVHLHFEVRPAPENGIKSTTVINPLTFFDPNSPLLEQWKNNFDVDYYLDGEDSLSLGYYQNVPIKP